MTKNESDGLSGLPPSAGLELVTAGLDLRESGPWLSILPKEGPIDLNLAEHGFASKQLVSARLEDTAEGRVLRFPLLHERLGDERIFLSDGRNEKPAMALRGVFAGARRAAFVLDARCSALCMVVHGTATDVQRNLVLRAGEASGWPAVRVVNRPLATAMGSPIGARLGRQLVVCLAHSALELGLIEWVDGVPQARGYAADPMLAADHLDATIAALIVGGQSDRLLASGGLVGGSRAFFWLKSRAQQVRQRLAHYDAVRVEIPDGVFGDGERSFGIGRREWAVLLDGWPRRFSALRDRALTDAGWEASSVQSVLLAGELARHPLVLSMLRRTLDTRSLSFELCDDSAAARGAAAIAARELRGEAREALAPPSDEAGAAPRVYTVRANSDRGVQPERAESGLADGIIQRARELAARGLKTEASAELQRLRQYVEALELSFREPLEVLGGGVRVGREADARAPTPAPESRPKPLKAVAAVDEERAKKREYLRAKEHIKDAEQALKEGRLAQAVAHSHAAYKESSDSRIFSAMIKVHLRAAARTPPTVQNFAEHREWLGCALNDDRTNQEVQSALRKRYLIHAEQILELEGPTAGREARRVLEELARAVEPGDAAVDLLRRLTPGGPAADEHEAR